jgi:hypothetical protein
MDVNEHERLFNIMLRHKLKAHRFCSYFVFQIIQIRQFKSQAMWRLWAAFSFENCLNSQSEEGYTQLVACYRLLIIIVHLYCIFLESTHL